MFTIKFQPKQIISSDILFYGHNVNITSKQIMYNIIYNFQCPAGVSCYVECCYYDSIPLNIVTICFFNCIDFQYTIEVIEDYHVFTPP